MRAFRSLSESPFLCQDGLIRIHTFERIHRRQKARRPKDSHLRLIMNDIPFGNPSRRYSL